MKNELNESGKFIDENCSFVDICIVDKSTVLKEFIADSKRSLLTELFTAIDYFDGDKKDLMCTVEKLIRIEYAYLCHNLKFDLIERIGTVEKALKLIGGT